ncbi:DM13 domain-containing protein [Parashewanella tropica]|uniref:DM13 domain-containing protein n=1 Tax=Parashewanella tropica TaxID=2547970 RepID=UPI00105A5DF8|nr:DM13 domain-containing protein [Parashewanella tropica]
MKYIFLFLSHLLIGAIGFAIGIYTLPILIEPTAPTTIEVQQASNGSIYQTQFVKNLTDSDAFHWGEGQVSIGKSHITFKGELAPGPDYKLYLSHKFVETEAEFKTLKSSMVQVGDIKTFNNFVVNVPKNVDPSKYQAVIVWCETFGEFITAAKYQ